MKILDLMWIALKNLKGRWVVLAVAGFALGAFFLCFASTIATTVHQEKSQPYELVVSSQGSSANLDNMIVKLSKLPGVTVATPLLQIPVTIKTQNYTAKLTLTGIDSAYLEDGFQKGGPFPDSSVMPYIVLNEAACVHFSSNKEESGTEDTSTSKTLTSIDWLNSSFTVQTGDSTHPITSKVCGLLADGKKEKDPSAYISLSVAKLLLKNTGQSTNAITAKVRVLNIGKADSVSKAITDLGLIVENPNEEVQTKWDNMMNEMRYMLMTGVFSLLCSSVLLSAYRRISRLEQKDTWNMLQWLGMRQRDIYMVYGIQVEMITFLGVAIGLIGSTSLPSFLPTEFQATSVFSLPISIGAAVASVVACMAAGSLSTLRKESK